MLTILVAIGSSLTFGTFQICNFLQDFRFFKLQSIFSVNASNDLGAIVLKYMWFQGIEICFGFSVPIEILTVSDFNWNLVSFWEYVIYYCVNTILLQQVDYVFVFQFPVWYWYHPCSFAINASNILRAVLVIVWELCSHYLVAMDSHIFFIFNCAVRFWPYSIPVK